ncbi:helix-hairpin-helix domain-containing protein [Streptomyces sp. KR80]|uniref:helix-hairpin-helix domain-containing protein n=1 Tax=Streptomyces sp. KR80 TaxID=3457426 RepID=UPI003FD01938
MEAVRQVLSEGGAPTTLASQAVEVLGEAAPQALREDPWQLLALPGVRPEQADGFARALLGSECGPGDERRAQALVHWLLERAALQGHTALEPAQLTAALAGQSVPDPEEALRTAIASGGVLVFQDALDSTGAGGTAAGDGGGDEEQPVRVLLGLDRYALAEESLADGLARLANTFTAEEGSASGPDPSARYVQGGAPAAERRGVERPRAASPGSNTLYPGSPDPDSPGTDSAGVGGLAGTMPSPSDWAAAAQAAAPSPSAGELIRAVAASGLVAHTGGEAARAEPAAVVAAARALGLRAYAAAHSEDGRRRLARLIDAAATGTTPAAHAAAGPAQPDTTGSPAGPQGPGPGTGARGEAEGRAPGIEGRTPGADDRDSAAVGHAPNAGGRADGAASRGPTAVGGLPGQAPEASEHGGREGVAGPAVTVAGLLSGAEGPGRDADGALALDVLAVLDAPQLDVETAAMLVESLPDGARLVLSGDPGVLWSAGPGRVFADVIAARACPQVASRTPDPGPISELVSGVGVGELNQVAAPGKEVVIVPVRDAGEAVHRTVQLVADSVPRAIGVPSEHTQVITPGHGGAVGTRALNAALKERLNPGPGRFGGFDPGDRVTYAPAPGRTLPGTVVSADADGLHLDCAGAAVLVPPDRVAETVRHGWAVTAHQAVGLRWPAAVVVLPGDATQTLTRSWVYTAFSRGERHLSVVHGAGHALPRAVAEAPVTERTTRLGTLLQTLAPPAG